MKKIISYLIVASFILNTFSCFSMLKKRPNITDLPPEVISHICAFLNYNYIDTDNFMRTSAQIFRGGLHFLKHECKEIAFPHSDPRVKPQKIKEILNSETIRQWKKLRGEDVTILIAKKIHLPPGGPPLQYQFKRPEEIRESEAPMLYNDIEKKHGNERERDFHVTLHDLGTANEFLNQSKRENIRTRCSDACKTMIITGTCIFTAVVVCSVIAYTIWLCSK